MNKRIVIEYDVGGDPLIFRIVEQTNIGNKFGPNGTDKFTHSGFRMCSSAYPEVQVECINGSHGMFVRGFNDTRNTIKLRAPSKLFIQALKKTEEAYNDKFWKKEEAEPEERIEEKQGNG